LRMADIKINMESIKSEIRSALINTKAFACPIAMRVAWHQSGTYDKNNKTGGSNGATMRFEPEASDPANAGLHIVRHMLEQVHKKHPEISKADLWTLAGCLAIEFMGGPHVPHRLGRTDDADGKRCPAHGRIPDATQGAEHLRAVFHRMGFDDRDIVALSGGHTVGRCHLVRSGFDGPWTSNPLQFDNEYFRNLMFKDWVEVFNDGPNGEKGKRQFRDKETEKLAMLPTDMALKTDKVFSVHALRYAKDQKAFFEDFSYAYGKLVSLGCPEICDPFRAQEQNNQKQVDARKKLNSDFREYCMHGSITFVKELSKQADVHEVELPSRRSALHKAAFWGHILTVDFLINEAKVNVNAQDVDGDTPLHDAVRYNHIDVVKSLLGSKNIDASIKNSNGKDPLTVAKEYNYQESVELLKNHLGSKAKL